MMIFCLFLLAVVATSQIQGGSHSDQTQPPTLPACDVGKQISAKCKCANLSECTQGQWCLQQHGCRITCTINAGVDQHDGCACGSNYCANGQFCDVNNGCVSVCTKDAEVNQQDGCACGVNYCANRQFCRPNNDCVNVCRIGFKVPQHQRGGCACKDSFCGTGKFCEIYAGCVDVCTNGAEVDQRPGCACGSNYCTHGQFCDTYNRCVSVCTNGAEVGQRPGCACGNIFCTHGQFCDTHNGCVSECTNGAEVNQRAGCACESNYCAHGQFCDTYKGCVSVCSIGIEVPQHQRGGCACKGSFCGTGKFCDSSAGCVDVCTNDAIVGQRPGCACGGIFCADGRFCRTNNECVEVCKQGYNSAKCQCKMNLCDNDKLWCDESAAGKTGLCSKECNTSNRNLVVVGTEDSLQNKAGCYCKSIHHVGKYCEKNKFCVENGGTKTCQGECSSNAEVHEAAGCACGANYCAYGQFCRADQTCVNVCDHGYNSAECQCQTKFCHGDKLWCDKSAWSNTGFCSKECSTDNGNLAFVSGKESQRNKAGCFCNSGNTPARYCDVDQFCVQRGRSEACEDGCTDYQNCGLSRPVATCPAEAKISCCACGGGQHSCIKEIPHDANATTPDFAVDRKRIQIFKHGFEMRYACRPHFWVGGGTLQSYSATCETATWVLQSQKRCELRRCPEKHGIRASLVNVYHASGEQTLSGEMNTTTRAECQCHNGFMRNVSLNGEQKDTVWGIECEDGEWKDPCVCVPQKCEAGQMFQSWGNIVQNNDKFVNVFNGMELEFQCSRGFSTNKSDNPRSPQQNKFLARFTCERNAGDTIATYFSGLCNNGDTCCQDINDCAVPGRECGGIEAGTCEEPEKPTANPDNNWFCKCNEGYEQVGEKDARTCKGINDCPAATDFSYKCGFARDGTQCRDKHIAYECVCLKGQVQVDFWKNENHTCLPAPCREDLHVKDADYTIAEDAALGSLADDHNWSKLLKRAAAFQAFTFKGKQNMKVNFGGAYNDSTLVQVLFGDTVNYECKVGTTTTGEPERTMDDKDRKFSATCEACDARGARLAARKQCHAIKCSLPMQPNTELDREDYLKYESKRMYRCKSGYTLNQGVIYGNASYGHGNFAYEIICKRYGLVYAANYNDNHAAAKKGDPVNAVLELCAPIRCSVDDAFAQRKNGATLLDSGENSDAKFYTYQKGVTYQCKPGTSLDGTVGGERNINVTCHADGKFHATGGKEWQCKPWHCEANATHLHARVTNANAPRLYQASVDLTCNPGYSINGTARGVRTLTAECAANGTLSSTEPCKKMRCGPPGATIENAHRATQADVASGAKFLPDSGLDETVVDLSLYFACNEGYTYNSELDGPRLQEPRCSENGEFLMESHQWCKRIKCTEPKNATANGTIAGRDMAKTLFFEDDVTWNCDLLHAARGKKTKFTRKCLADGSWSPPNPSGCTYVNQCTKTRADTDGIEELAAKGEKLENYEVAQLRRCGVGGLCYDCRLTTKCNSTYRENADDPSSVGVDPNGLFACECKEGDYQLKLSDDLLFCEKVDKTALLYATFDSGEDYIWVPIALIGSSTMMIVIFSFGILYKRDRKNNYEAELRALPSDCDDDDDTAFE